MGYFQPLWRQALLAARHSLTDLEGAKSGSEVGVPDSSCPRSELLRLQRPWGALVVPGVSRAAPPVPGSRQAAARVRPRAAPVVLCRGETAEPVCKQQASVSQRRDQRCTLPTDFSGQGRPSILLSRRFLDTTATQGQHMNASPGTPDTNSHQLPFLPDQCSKQRSPSQEEGAADPILP